MDVRSAALNSPFGFQGNTTRLWAVLASILVTTTMGCTGSPQTLARIGLLAPFEGRYREVGYNAYYAARLALQDHAGLAIELLAIDDGGSVGNAADRALALAGDPLVKAVIVLGYAATDTRAQQAFGDVPVIVAGHWGTTPQTEKVFMLASPELENIITTPPQIDVMDAATLTAPVIGGEVFALEQFPKLRPTQDGITVATSASLPEDTFRVRYMSSFAFAPEPNLFATLTYKAMQLLLANTQVFERFDDERVSRQGQSLLLSIRSEDGYITNADVHYYGYNTEDKLVPIDDPVE